ncbi:MAG: phosphoribosyltransferase [Nitrospirae bacterium RBG_13_43_8]|nr:MAG: phosphoribosyltransferase [Nitrospirae bacterium RBG_13_43_8]
MMFNDRRDAGVQLASRLEEYKGQTGVLVLALPRGGVATGYEIAHYLKVPLDIVIVRKIGFPGQPELAIGAVSETGRVVLNESIISTYGVSKDYIEREVSQQKKEISRRAELYRKGKRLPSLEGKTIILVDDGVATGATMKAAIITLKEEKLKKLIVALPVAPVGMADEIEQMADTFICIETPFDFMAVGAYYQDFTQVSDEEVIDLLERSAKKLSA